MEAIERVLSRPVAKPYRTGKIDPNEIPYLNADGHIDFAEGDIENPRNWPARRRWYITTASILLVLNATFASSIPAGCLNVGTCLQPFDIDVLKVEIGHCRTIPCQ